METGTECNGTDTNGNRENPYGAAAHRFPEETGSGRRLSDEGLEKEIRQERETNEENKKRKIQEDYHRAVPYQSGMKWGLKVGERITVPPIYRHIQKPVGKYCTVEKNHSQWGIISIDGTALLTHVTGKKTTVHLK